MLGTSILFFLLANPRHPHPQGSPPTAKTPKTLTTLSKIRECLGEAPHVLVDGNNVRGAVGSPHLSDATAMTGAISDVTSKCYRRHGLSISKPLPPPLTAVVWDGGKGGTPSAKALIGNDRNAAAVFSGENSNADDVVVQLCAYLDEDDDTPTVVVFTSDVNLAGRCELQSARRGVRVFHSVYLVWLLEEEAEDGGMERGDSGRMKWSHLEPDWEREERRESVLRLQSSVLVRSCGEGDDEEAGGRFGVGRLVCWFDEACPGVQIGRVTKGGSILYAFDSGG